MIKIKETRKSNLIKTMKEPAVEMNDCISSEIFLGDFYNMLHACEVEIYVNATITVKGRIYIYI